jgi:hypothetical protein
MYFIERVQYRKRNSANISSNISKLVKQKQSGNIWFPRLYGDFGCKLCIIKTFLGYKSHSNKQLNKSYLLPTIPYNRVGRFLTFFRFWSKGWFPW